MNKCLEQAQLLFCSDVTIATRATPYDVAVFTIPMQLVVCIQAAEIPCEPHHRTGRLNALGQCHWPRLRYSGDIKINSNGPTSLQESRQITAVMRCCTRDRSPSRFPRKVARWTAVTIASTAANTRSSRMSFCRVPTPAPWRPPAIRAFL